MIYSLFFTLFRVKVKQEERPEKYDDIFASPAMRSLPEEPNSEEEEIVRTVIQQCNDMVNSS